MEPGSKKLNIIKGKDIEEQIYGGVENGLGTSEYELKKLELDRSQATIAKYYPDVRAKKLKEMYAKHHPLADLNTASFGRVTDGVTNPKHPKK
jgi:hypothetical protein